MLRLSLAYQRGAVVHAEEGINGKESANIVGYQNVAITNGYQFFTVTFEQLGNETKFNLSDVECLKADGTAWLRTGAGTVACSGQIYLRKIDAKGAYGQEYKYYGKSASDTFGPGWYVGDRAADGSNLVTDDDVTLKSGEGVIVYCGRTAGQLRVAGGVKMKTFTEDVVNGYQFGGNCTPTTLNLSAVQCLKSDGTAWQRTGAGTVACSGQIYLRKIDSKGAYGQEYKYYGKNDSDTFGPGWYVGDRAADGSNLVTDDDVTFKPGEGWIMYCGRTAAKIVIPSPIK